MNRASSFKFRQKIKQKTLAANTIPVKKTLEDLDKNYLDLNSSLEACILGDFMSEVEYSLEDLLGDVIHKITIVDRDHEGMLETLEDLKDEYEKSKVKKQILDFAKSQVEYISESIQKELFQSLRWLEHTIDEVCEKKLEGAIEETKDTMDWIKENKEEKD